MPTRFSRSQHRGIHTQAFSGKKRKPNPETRHFFFSKKGKYQIFYDFVFKFLDENEIVVSSVEKET
jgi:hypothetical protein